MAYVAQKCTYYKCNKHFLKTSYYSFINCVVANSKDFLREKGKKKSNFQIKIYIPLTNVWITIPKEISRDNVINIVLGLLYSTSNFLLGNESTSG